jgi:SAM-dependent methyltransferase
MSVDYDKLAQQYKKYRMPDPRIAEQIHFHLRNAQRILNVGAGTGSYEPEDCEVVALEPYYEMISRRKHSGALLIQGSAEELPFKDNTFDCSMGILTIHHWSDTVSGLQEMLRVTRDRIVLLTWIGYGNNFWLVDYIPEIVGIDEKLFPTLEELDQILGGISVETIEIPHDCTDGFMCAYWRRPEMYLDPDARRAISTFSRMPASRIPAIQEQLDKLKEDIKSGVWCKKYSHLLERESLDLGYRLVVSEKS